MKQILLHLLIVASGITIFWAFHLTDIKYIYLWMGIIMPISNLLISYFFGKKWYEGWKYRYVLFSMYCGLSTMGLFLSTFAAYPLIKEGRLKSIPTPDLGFFFLGFITSFCGMWIGYGKLIREKKQSEIEDYEEFDKAS